MAQVNGTVKWFNSQRGYGFISPDDGGEDLLVHHTDIVGRGFKYLVEGERVACEVIRARNVARARYVYVDPDRAPPTVSGRAVAARRTAGA